MANVVNAATMTVGANTCTNILNVHANNPGPSRVTLRTSSSGVKIGGQDLDVSGTNYGFELLPNVEYTFDIRQIYGQWTTSSAEGTLYVRNTNGSSVTVSVIYTALAVGSN